MFNLCEFLHRDKKHLFQKCLSMDKVKKEIQFPVYVSEKIDGVFCCAIKDDEGKVHICSRTGEEYFSMEHLKPYLEDIIYDDFVIFEAWVPNTPQPIISGYCRDTKNQHEELEAIVHTFVYGGMYDLTMKAFSINAPALTTVPNANVSYLTHIEVNSMKELQEFVNEVWERGGEGAVIHSLPHGIYYWGKRNATMIKWKKGLSLDLEVVGVFSGSGKYAGTLGGLLCRYKDNKTVRVSGMTDKQRHEWWKNPDLIIGEIVEVEAMCESSKGLLREPRFKSIRYDKEGADY